MFIMVVGIVKPAGVPTLLSLRHVQNMNVQLGTKPDRAHALGRLGMNCAQATQPTALCVAIDLGSLSRAPPRNLCVIDGAMIA